MKLKCVDGKVREFSIAFIDPMILTYVEASCLECGQNFGVHDTRVLKPEFKKHICRIEKPLASQKKQG